MSPTSAAAVKKHLVSLYVANKFGVLNRIALVFARRGFNIDSLVVSEADDPAFSHMNIVASGDEKTLEQILKQLNKLINVIKVVDFRDVEHVSREMVLVKINATERNREEILRMTEIFRGKVIDVSARTYTIEITGTEDKIKAFLTLVKPLGIKELVRTGPVAMIRGEKMIQLKEKDTKEGG